MMDPIDLNAEARRLRRELRETRKHLRELIAVVNGHVGVMDQLMKMPSTPDRGNTIATLCNRLELAKDIAKRYGLPVRGRKLGSK